MVFVSQKPLVGCSHEGVEEQKRWSTVTFDVKHIYQISVFGRYGVSAISRMAMVLDKLALEHR